jgi:hypothetical protein
MDFKQSFSGSVRALTLLCLALPSSGLAQQTSPSFPFPETLTYRIDWRMVTAGTAKLQLAREQQDWQIHLALESAGLVSRLYRVTDDYKATVNDQFCGLRSSFEAQEGKRHVIESQQFDNARHKGFFDFHDLVKNQKQHQEIDIAPCTHEIVGALEALRDVKLDPGKALTMPIANGKKMVNARIQAQGKESLTVNGTKYATTRYEAFIFDNVLFRRRGQLLIWLTDDAAHVPVQLQFQMGFPIGNVALELEKAEHN